MEAFDCLLVIGRASEVTFFKDQSIEEPPFR